MKKFIAFISSAAFLAPLFASAQALTDINSVSTKATNIGNLVIGIAISLAVLWIIISIVRYLILGATDEEKRKEGRASVIWGVIGLAVILSIWGLVAILRNSFRTQDQIPLSEINRTTTLPQPAQVPN